ncbi:MAG: mechanosensitive ion channel family protein [Myxococcota bacterium]
MQQFLENLEGTTLAAVASTATLLLLVVLLRATALRQLRAAELPMEIRRRWRIVLRNVAIAIFLAGVGVIWADQIRGVAVSMIALAAALVLATKELITCITGSVLRTSNGYLKVGDRIEIAGVRGDVIDIGALTTTLLEIGPGTSIHQATGRVVVLPNSVFLTQSFANESFAKEFVFHTFVVPVSDEADVKATEERLLAVTREETEEFRAPAEAALGEMARARHIEPPSAVPRVWIQIVAPDRIELTVRFVVLARMRGRVEQKILREFFARSPGKPKAADEDA